jgi:putative chitinase
MITLKMLYEIFPFTARRKLRDFLRVCNDIALPELELNSILRVSAFIAQTAHEADSFKTMQEYASGKGYEGRKDLGNNMPGDGVKYKGRGYIQLTGRHNYTKFNAWYAVKEPHAPDFVHSPEMIGQIPELAIWATVFYWQRHNLNQYSDNGLFKTLTKKINGGLNGYDHRLEIFEKVHHHITKQTIL